MKRARHYHLPPGTGTFGMTLFLVSMGMLFLASIVGYLAVRFRTDQPAPPGGLDLPAVLWVTTLIIIASSLTINAALGHVRLERQNGFRRNLTLTLIMTVAFLGLQTVGLGQLLTSHARHDEVQLYGLVFFIVLVHAAHLLGGLLPLTVIAFHAHRGRYDHEHHRPIVYVAMYWHFLAGVWISMFAVIQIAA